MTSTIKMMLRSFFMSILDVLALGWVRRGDKKDESQD